MEKEELGGREVFLTERAELRKKNQQEYERGFTDGMHIDPKAVDFLNEITTSLEKSSLTSIFSEYLVKSGVSLDRANHTVLDSIKTRHLLREGTAAFYIALTNDITLSEAEEDIFAAKKRHFETGHIPESLLMKIRLFLIHELCHAFSRNRIFTKDANNSQALVSAESGFSVRETVIRQPARRFGTEKGKSVLFEALNEGVTQRVAEEVFLELHLRLGKGKEAKEFLGDFIEGSVHRAWRYSVYANQVESMCERVSEYVGVPQDIVWGAFKRGYFAKPELFVQETIDLFESTFGPGFLNSYSQLGNKTPMRALGEFDMRSNMAPLDEYAEKWKIHLGIVRE